jgi:hypothetical protein
MSATLSAIAIRSARSCASLAPKVIDRTSPSPAPDRAGPRIRPPRRGCRPTPRTLPPGHHWPSPRRLGPPAGRRSPARCAAAPRRRRRALGQRRSGHRGRRPRESARSAYADWSWAEVSARSSLAASILSLVAASALVALVFLVGKVGACGRREGHGHAEAGGEERGRDCDARAGGRRHRRHGTHGGCARSGISRDVGVSVVRVVRPCRPSGVTPAGSARA